MLLDRVAPTAAATGCLQPLHKPIPLHVLDNFRDLPITLQGATQPVLCTSRVLFGGASAKLSKHLDVRVHCQCGRQPRTTHSGRLKPLLCAQTPTYTGCAPSRLM